MRNLAMLDAEEGQSMAVRKIEVWAEGLAALVEEPDGPESVQPDAVPWTGNHGGLRGMPRPPQSLRAATAELQPRRWRR
jgi:hypothetical protein